MGFTPEKQKIALDHLHKAWADAGSAVAHADDAADGLGLTEFRVYYFAQLWEVKDALERVQNRLKRLVSEAEDEPLDNDPEQ